MSLGAFAMVLHTHIPYVLSHGRWPHGTDWLAEAAGSSYVPLVRGLESLLERGVPVRLTVGVTPILAEQLAVPAGQDEIEGWLEAKTAAAAHDAEVFGWERRPDRVRLARRWEEAFGRRLDDFRGRWDRDLVGALRRLQEAGAVELATSAATHAYLPLLGTDEAVRAQIRLGTATHRRHFGRAPRGLWLPECGYRPGYRWTPPVGGPHRPPAARRAGIEAILAAEGIDWFVVDAHLLRGGAALGTYGDRHPALRRLAARAARAVPPVAEPDAHPPTRAYRVRGAAPPPRPVHVLVREPELSLQVWSADHGYPGDADYLEFHKRHTPTGLRYWRVTGPGAPLDAKAEFDPARAAERVEAHAEHFHARVRARLAEHRAAFGEPGLVVTPFDTELFGHWWGEGVEWLLRVLERIAADPEIELTTCAARLDTEPAAPETALGEGSWGEGGHHAVWLNHGTDAVWRELYRAELELRALAARPAATPEARRLLALAARELLLLQASDWTFLISTGSAADYARQRLDAHLRAFDGAAGLARRLLDGGAAEAAEWEAVAEAEARDGALFPDLDPALWR